EQSDGQFKPRRVEKHGRTLILFNLGPLSLGQSICVDNDWLILGSPQVVESFLLRRDGVLPAWEPSPDWQQAIDAMPDRVAAITVRDGRGIVTRLAGLPPGAVSVRRIGLNE